jgi:hypothetical protein
MPTNAIWPSTMALIKPYSTTLPVAMEELDLLPAFAAVLQAEMRMVMASRRLKSLREIFIRYSFGMDNFH